ncbi:barstar family protein [Proteiniclasticum sp. BAD-10]|jgi:ribonuclease inhibitor|uniref:Barstar family protein n=1 Tax=Proteiniclasticum sediminis TaxID=2804028 RepID=A0A941CQS6_9CLOT|nr:barstar family protein [Proteiniclasticum sediminis]MBR0576527.1 barstar family protein [Proteiniclasticum sediminis]
MDRIILNGKRMITREKTHAYLKRKFSFPDYYGKNLDALWDLLSTWDQETEVVILHRDAVLEQLGDYGASLLDLFGELQEESRHLTITFAD